MPVLGAVWPSMSGAAHKDASVGTALLSAPEVCAAAWREPWLSLS